MLKIVEIEVEAVESSSLLTVTLALIRQNACFNAVRCSLRL